MGGADQHPFAQRRVAREDAREEQGPAGIEYPRGGRVDDPICVAYEHGCAGDRPRAQHRQRISDGEAGHRGGVLGVRGTSQVDLVDHGLLGSGNVGGRLAVGGHFLEPWCPGQQVCGFDRTGSAVALIRQICSVHYIAHRHETCDRCQALGLESLLLHPAVDCRQEGRGLRRAEGDELAGYVAAVHQSGSDGIYGGSPAVGGEVRPRHLPHSGVGVRVVEVGGCVKPVLRHLLGSLHGLAHQLRLPYPRVVQHHGQDHAAADDRAEPRHPSRQCADARSGQHRDGQRHHGNGPRRGPESQAGVELGERLEGFAQKRRAVVGVGAHRHQSSHREQEQKVAAVLPPDRRGEGQCPYNDSEADEHQPVAQRVVDAGVD